jgi:hypothetical protein
MVPHGLNARELVSGRSRLKMLHDPRFNVRVAPNMALEEGLDAAGARQTASSSTSRRTVLNVTVDPGSRNPSASSCQFRSPFVPV